MGRGCRFSGHKLLPTGPLAPLHSCSAGADILAECADAWPQSRDTGDLFSGSPATAILCCRLCPSGLPPGPLSTGPAAPLALWVCTCYSLSRNFLKTEYTLWRDHT